MPDTKLSDIATELTEFQDTDRLYAVQYDGSPPSPVSKFVTYETLLGAIGEEVGGGGNVTSTGAHGAQPGSPTSGDLYLPNNANHIERYSGAAWAPWGPIWPLTDPNAPSWAWVNQGSATLETANGGPVIYAPPSASDTVKARVIALPATPFTITAIFQVYVNPVNYQYAGIFWYDATKWIVFGIGTAATYTGGVALINSKAATVTSAPSSAYIELQNHIVNRNLIHLQVTDNGTNRISRYSADGYTWVDVHTVGRTDHLTATHVGFCVNNANATYPCYAKLLSWKQT